MKKAILSVSDKFHLLNLAQELVKKDFQIYSTGGTLRHLREGDINALSIEELTGRGEFFDGRVKTLGHEILGGILFDRTNPVHVKEAQEHNIPAIDLVVCNLYPFERAYESGANLDELIENIDIGGVALLRSAAKNYQSVSILCDPSDYNNFIAELNNENDISNETRFDLALKAFEHTANYDTMIHKALNEKRNNFSSEQTPQNLETILRYGENPHQKAKLKVTGEGLASAALIQGKEMSYNNYLDADCALNVTSDLVRYTPFNDNANISIIKHGNPCGVASAKTSISAFEMAWASDPVSSFGSIICIDKMIDAELASLMSQKFIEVIIAPAFSEDALKILAKKKNLRLLAYPKLGKKQMKDEHIVSISGGVLTQDKDNRIIPQLTPMTYMQIGADEMDTVVFGQICCKHLKSNAISLCMKQESGLSLVGAGMGNPNRVISVRQAIEKARENGVHDFSSVIAHSDAFFPFVDNLEIFYEAGIKKIIQPGGSVRDDDIIQFCNEHNMAMSFTHERHFRH